MATSFLKIPEFTRGIRFRLSVVYSALFGICLIFLSIFITGEYFQLARDDYDQYLRNYALDITNSIVISDDLKSATLQIPMTESIKFFPFVIQNTIVCIRDIEGKVLYSSRPSVDIPYNKSISNQNNYTHRFLSFELDNEKMRALNLKVNLKDSSTVVLQVASSHESLVKQEETHFFFLLAVIPITILISAFLATLVSGQALEPIRELSNQMEDLLEGGNYTPLPVPNTHDEIEKLTRSFNNLIVQMQDTLEAQESFVSHASHQLNTPLAIMRGELEVLTSKERSIEEINKFHTSLQQELLRLTQLVKDMLLVSRVEAGKEHFRFIPLQLDEVLGETLERLATHAKKKNISLRYNIDPELVEEESALTYSGERQLLVCLFENLLENAIKYSPHDSRISVRLDKSAQGVYVEVSDEGPGMSHKILENYMAPKRFYRGDDVTGISGSGLGLYLAQKIIEYHNAKLEIVPNEPKGTIIRVYFRGPLSA